MKIKREMVFLVLLFSTFLVFSATETVDLVHLGSVYGGWAVPSTFSRDSVCYSVGAGEDISFDIALAKKFGCNVFIFDPTPRAEQHFNYVKRVAFQGGQPSSQSGGGFPYDVSDSILYKLTFFPWGIWFQDKVVKFYEPQNTAHVSHSIVNVQHTKDYFKAPCKRIATIMSELGHDRIDLLKLDIEGGEYSVIRDFLREKISIYCFCVEFHEVKGESEDQAVKMLLNSGFELRFKEGRNYTFINSFN